MSFENHYPNRKDWRKPYYRSGRFDRSCRPHGSCSYCRDTRLYQYRKELERVEQELRENGFVG